MAMGRLQVLALAALGATALVVVLAGVKWSDGTSELFQVPARSLRESQSKEPTVAGIDRNSSELSLEIGDEGTPSDESELSLEIEIGDEVVPSDESMNQTGSENLNSSVNFAKHRGGGHGWHWGGDKVWGSGSGMESISSGNVGYFDSGMQAARGHCGGAGCALITNPAGHRSINQFHIHSVNYAGWGASLHKRLESKVCGKGGWHGGGLPCGGKAAFFPGFPAVFSKAMGGGSISHASVVAWPGSCGGDGTIVELAFGCSIEHQIRGDFDPSRR
jgi:hypothetical protein